MAPVRNRYGKLDFSPPSHTTLSNGADQASPNTTKFLTEEQVNNAFAAFDEVDFGALEDDGEGLNDIVVVRNVDNTSVIRKPRQRLRPKQTNPEGSHGGQEALADLNETKDSVIIESVVKNNAQAEESVIVLSDKDDASDDIEFLKQVSFKSSRRMPKQKNKNKAGQITESPNNPAQAKPVAAAADQPGPSSAEPVEPPALDLSKPFMLAPYTLPKLSKVQRRQRRKKMKNLGQPEVVDPRKWLLKYESKHFVFNCGQFWFRTKRCNESPLIPLLYYCQTVLLRRMGFIGPDVFGPRHLVEGLPPLRSVIDEAKNLLEADGGTVDLNGPFTSPYARPSKQSTKKATAVDTAEQANTLQQKVRNAQQVLDTEDFVSSGLDIPTTANAKADQNKPATKPSQLLESEATASMSTNPTHSQRSVRSETTNDTKPTLGPNVAGGQRKSLKRKMNEKFAENASSDAEPSKKQPKLEPNVEEKQVNGNVHLVKTEDGSLPDGHTTPTSLEHCRPLVNVKRSDPRDSGPCLDVSFCTYNVLCEKIRKRCSYLYHKNNPAHTPWNVRKQRIQRHLAGDYKADVICLQEVEKGHVSNFFAPMAKKMGYTVHYSERGNGNPDGCMVMFDSKKFNVVKYQEVRYNQDVEGFEKDNVAQLLLLRHAVSQLCVGVANTHILFNMKRGDLKLGQLMLLFANAHLCAEHQPSLAGFFFCGDFNVQPHSPLHRYVLDARIDVTGMDRSQLPRSGTSPSDESQKNLVELQPGRVNMDYSCGFKRGLLCPTPVYKHPFHLMSAYPSTSENDEPVITTRHSDADAPDYIFYQCVKSADGKPEESRIHLTAIRRLPTLSEIDQTCGPMPNEECGSDHIPLWASFRVY